jgi:GDP-D-glucose phosphorylase
MKSSDDRCLYLQLNIDRHLNRRAPEKITCISQPFDATKFNFTKVKKEEYLFKITKNSGTDSAGHFLVINVSPLEYGHALLLPDLFGCLPQVVTLGSLQFIVEVLLLSGSP